MRSSVLRRSGVAALGLLVLAGFGCHATKQEKVDPSTLTTGFLGSGYALLQPGASGQADLRWVDPDAQWTRYDAVMIDPVTFWGDDKTRISPAQQQALSNYFYGALKKQLAQRFRIVDAPAPGVMRLQVAITDVAAATPGLRTISTIVPQLHALNTAQSLATGQLLFVGGAQVEGKLTDAATGKLLAEAVDREAGGGNVDAALQWQWGDAENAMDLWAEKLAQRLAEWHGGASAS